MLNLRTDEGGFTLIELLVVMMCAVIVFGVPMSFVIEGLNQQNVSASRTAAATQEEVGLNRLTRDLRQVVPSTTSTFTWSSSTATASLTLPVPGTGGASTETVAWNCSFGASGSCTRSVNAGTAVTVISNVEGVSFNAVDESGNVLGGSGPSYSATNPGSRSRCSISASSITAHHRRMR
jgi:Tfp pilus assembly protein PilW